MIPTSEVLHTSPLVGGLTEAQIHALGQYAESRQYAHGQFVIAEGSPSDCLFVLKQGTVTVEKGATTTSVILATVGEPGAFFGEMSLVDVLPHSAYVRSRGMSEVLAFQKKHLVSFFTEHPEAQMVIILNISRVLSLRLREANERIVQLSIRLASEDKEDP